MASIEEILAEAKALHRAGRLSEAESRYRHILSSGVATAETYFLRALCCQGRGAWADAIASLRQAIDLQPDHADAHHYLGVLLAQQGALDDAVASLQEARRLLPDSVDVAENLRRVRVACQSDRAASLARAGQLVEATVAFQNVVEDLPDDADARYNLGFALLRQDRIAEAMSSFQQSLALNSHHLDARFQLANAMVKLGQPDEAARHYRQLLELKSDHIAALNNLGSVLREQNRLEEAIGCYRRALAVAPQSAEAHNNLGVALMNHEQVDEALACYDEAVRIMPDYADPYANRATACLMQYRPADALVQCERALQLDPEHVVALHNASFALLNQGKLDEVLVRARRAVELNSDHAESHFFHAMMLLMAGKFDPGWKEYEWRWRRPGQEERPLQQPRWSGDPLAGRKILLRTEQGYGDSLQFIRYAKLVKQQGATVVVECEGVLARLFSRCPGVDQVVVRGEALPPFDVHAPLLSLPLLFRTTTGTIPASVPYLEPDADAVSRWQAGVAPDPSFKVGIVWRGNSANLIDRRRSIPLAQFAPLARLPGVRLYSLQKGPAREELSRVASDWPVTDLADRLVDFHDSACAMRNLDLVITCDSSPAHLAGGLGVPVTVALAYVPDWRWLLRGDTSAWYPTMQLFRQSQPGDWGDVFRRISEEVAAKL